MMSTENCMARCMSVCTSSAAVSFSLLKMLTYAGQSSAHMVAGHALREWIAHKAGGPLIRIPRRSSVDSSCSCAKTACTSPPVLANKTRPRSHTSRSVSSIAGVQDVGGLLLMCCRFGGALVLVKQRSQTSLCKTKMMKQQSTRLMTCAKLGQSLHMLMKPEQFMT